MAVGVIDITVPAGTAVLPGQDYWLSAHRPAAGSPASSGFISADCSICRYCCCADPARGLFQIHHCIGAIAFLGIRLAQRPRASLSFGFARTACCSSGMALPAMPESTAAKPLRTSAERWIGQLFCCSASCDCAAATLSPSLKIERYFFQCLHAGIADGHVFNLPVPDFRGPSRPAFDFAICSQTAKLRHGDRY